MVCVIDQVIFLQMENVDEKHSLEADYASLKVTCFKTCQVKVNQNAIVTPLLHSNLSYSVRDKYIINLIN